MLSAIVIIGVVFSCSVTASAAQTVTFDTIYTHTYTDKNCYNTVTLPEDGFVYFEMGFPTDKYGYQCKPRLVVTSGGTTICNRMVYYGTQFVFLNKGTYTFNIYMENYTPITSMSYCFQFRENANDNVRPVTFGTKYLHYYKSKNCYGSFELKQNSTVRIDLIQPTKHSDNTTHYSSTLYVYNMSKGGTEVLNEYYSGSQSSSSYYYTLRLPKGKYKFNYSCSSASSLSSDGYTVDGKYAIYTYYKVTATKATKPKTPKISQTVKTTKYSNFTTYDVDATFADNEAYDGVELWTKNNNGKWKLADSAANTKYLRNCKVDIYVSSASTYVMFYKVRTYSLYGTSKVYSNWSNTLYTKTSLKPKKPTVTVKSAKKAAKISWKKISGADGYVIYRSTKKNSGYKKVKTITKGSTTSYTNKSLKSKKTYYYKVRTYKKVNGVTIYSSYSTPKKVKTK